MSGPKDAAAAKVWSIQCMGCDAWKIAGHMSQRMLERGISFEDVRSVLLAPTRIDPDAGMPEHGGTKWRMRGKSLDSETLIVVVEMFEDGGKWIMLITVFADDTKTKQVKK